jgi:hypothetical protein
VLDLIDPQQCDPLSMSLGFLVMLPPSLLEHNLFRRQSLLFYCCEDLNGEVG